jgi:hypothetical protein
MAAIHRSPVTDRPGSIDNGIARAPETVSLGS